MTEWISIEDDQPEDGEIVCVYDEYSDFMSMGKYVDNGDEYYFELMHIEKIECDSLPTHWIRKPKRPLD